MAQIHASYSLRVLIIKTVLHWLLHKLGVIFPRYHCTVSLSHELTWFFFCLIYLQIVQVVLDGLNNMLRIAGEQRVVVANLIEECGGLDKIEQLQGHDNQEIYRMAFNIIDTYFSSEGEEDGAIAPQENDNGFQFNSGGNAPDGGFIF